MRCPVTSTCPAVAQPEVAPPARYTPPAARPSVGDVLALLPRGRVPREGAPLDGPLDTTTGLSWVGYANSKLRQSIEPLILEFLKSRRK